MIDCDELLMLDSPLEGPAQGRVAVVVIVAGAGGVLLGQSTEINAYCLTYIIIHD